MLTITQPNQKDITLNAPDTPLVLGGTLSDIPLETEGQYLLHSLNGLFHLTRLLPQKSVSRSILPRLVPTNKTIPIEGSCFIHQHEPTPLAQSHPRARNKPLETRPLERAASGAAFELLIYPTPTHLKLKTPSKSIRLKNRAQTPLWVGSSTTCDIQIHDATVSGCHLRFEPHRHQWFCRDLKSKNGTFFNGIESSLTCLKDGHRIQIGRCEIHVRQMELDVPFISVDNISKTVFTDATRYAQTGWPILIQGETGVGKDVLAQHIHKQSREHSGPFVAINAGSFPSTLIESELFGHVKGAFTGADQDKKGAFLLAHGGTLFLDEIGELPLDMQTRLLRVLEHHEIKPLGSERSIPVQVRLLFATHRNLELLIQKQLFREDLYYRISRGLVFMPPLRERKNDLLPLADYFIKDLCRELGPRSLTFDACKWILEQPWYGNARALKNVLCRAAMQTSNGMIDVSHLLNASVPNPRLDAPFTSSPGDASPFSSTQPSSAMVHATGASATVGHSRLLHYHETLARFDGNMSKAASFLNIPRTTFRDKIKSAYKSTP